MTKSKNNENNKKPQTDEGENPVSKQKDTDKVGQDKNTPASLDDFEKLLKDDFKLKRVYRSDKEDLTNPNKSPHHSSNRLTKNLGTRISLQYIDRFNAVATNFPNKRAALERAIELLESEPFEDHSPN